MIIRELNGKKPQFGDDCFIAENAVIVGDVQMGDQCSIWYNAVLRGDVHFIKLGNKVHIKNVLLQLVIMYLSVITHLFMVVQYMIMF